MGIEIIGKKPPLRTTDIIQREAAPQPRRRDFIGEFFTPEERERMEIKWKQPREHPGAMKAGSAVYQEMMMADPTDNQQYRKRSVEKINSGLRHEWTFAQALEILLEARHYYPQLPVNPTEDWYDSVRLSARYQTSIGLRTKVMRDQIALALVDPEKEIPQARQNNFWSRIESGIPEYPHYLPVFVFAAQLLYPGKIFQYPHLVALATQSLENFLIENKKQPDWDNALKTAHALAALQTDGIRMTSSGFEFIPKGEDAHAPAQHCIPTQPEVRRYGN